MKWATFAIGVAIVGAGCYTLWLKDTKTGATLIGVGALLIDPVDVLKALGIWKNAPNS